MCQRAVDAQRKWCNSFNPSANSPEAKRAAQMIGRVRDSILAHCEVSSASHHLIFNSGASEGNCFVIRSCVRSLKRRLAVRNSDSLPHVVVSAVEHNSIMSCVRGLVADGEINVSYVQPNIYGTIDPRDVVAQIRPTTCLVSIMFANNEIPAVNNIAKIVREVNTYCAMRAARSTSGTNRVAPQRIPVHTDAVQLFGKAWCNIALLGVQALTASAHKFYGPKSMGLLIMSKEFTDGYKLTAEIAGSQQDGLRGGTENVAGIAAVGAALKAAFSRRISKNGKLWSLRHRLEGKIREKYTVVPYVNYIGRRHALATSGQPSDVMHEDLEIVFLGPVAGETKESARFVLNNTMLLAICKNRGKPFCNVKLIAYCAKNHVSVSVGSACNTHSDHASHVLDAIGAPPVVKRGVMRVSFGDGNTMEEVDRFMPILERGIALQCCDLRGLRPVNSSALSRGGERGEQGERGER